MFISAERKTSTVTVMPDLIGHPVHQFSTTENKELQQFPATKNKHLHQFPITKNKHLQRSIYFYCDLLLGGQQDPAGVFLVGFLDRGLALGHGNVAYFPG